MPHRSKGRLPIFAAEGALAVLDQAQDIVLVEMVRERLHDACKAVGFQMQLCIVHHSAQLVGLTVQSLPSKCHCTAPTAGCLVKYLHSAKIGTKKHPR